MEERGRRIFFGTFDFKFVPNSHDRSFTNLVFAKSYLWMMRGGGSSSRSPFWHFIIIIISSFTVHNCS